MDLCSNEVLEERRKEVDGSERESKTDEQRAFQIACVVVSTRADQAFLSSFRLFLGPLGGARWTKLG